MRFCLVLAVAAALLLPAAADAVPIAKKTIRLTGKDADITVAYPQTGNRAIDAALAAYARKEVADFQVLKPDFAGGDRQYTLDVSYAVERNDAQMLGVVFTEFTDSGGAHPNTNQAAFNFLLPDGAQVFLPEIVDGKRGIARISQLAVADLIGTIGSGAEPLSDKDTIASGAAPLADNFKVFVWLPRGLHIHFPAYQVASYAAGPQEVTIPLARLRDVIRPDWRAPAPSFDCARARSPNEKAICGDAALARLDRLMAEAYETGLHNASYDKAAQQTLLQAQRDWLAKTNAACAASVPCLGKAYRARLDALTKAVQ